jgi:hypothetical protein
MSETRISRRRALQGAAIAGAAGLAALAPRVVQASSGEEPGTTIVGSWRGTVSTTGAPSFGALTSFAAGGTLVSSASVDLQPNNLATPGYGAWRRTDDGRYAVTFQFFTFDPHSNPAGSGEVKARLTVDGDHLHGHFTVTIFDPAGHVVFTASGSLEATRIEAD